MRHSLPFKIKKVGLVNDCIAYMRVIMKGISFVVGVEVIKGISSAAHDAVKFLEV